MDNTTDTINVKDSSLIAIPADTSGIISDSASIDKSINIVLYQLQSIVLEQGYAIRRYRAVVISLVIVISFLVTVIILSVRKYLYFPQFPYYKQKKGFHPGLVCLKMVAKYFGNRISYRKIKRIVKESEPEAALTLQDIVGIAEKVGLQAGVIRTDIKQLVAGSYLPAIIYLPNHMVILHKISNEFIFIADPFYGFLKLKMYYFLSAWYAGYNNKQGIALLIRPLKYSKSKTKRVNKALSLDFSKIKLLDNKYWSDFKFDIRQ